MMETKIRGNISVGEEEIKLEVYDHKFTETRIRWNLLHSFFLSLELQTVQKLGIPVAAYRQYIEVSNSKHAVKYDEWEKPTIATREQLQDLLESHNKGEISLPPDMLKLVEDELKQADG